ncbi:hypothetical protein H2201_005124 [Coniosporium apollinis]|uniref:Uncharacterized protein n=1 Tax=Coniosporium apollinis TaxID=61459 RepID=A0ABQ9NQR0_9PEZI|nr:hypothetical protein H2201_005124 [Coniosporium apollinis]
MPGSPLDSNPAYHRYKTLGHLPAGIKEFDKNSKGEYIVNYSELYYRALNEAGGLYGIKYNSRSALVTFKRQLRDEEEENAILTEDELSVKEKEKMEVPRITNKKNLLLEHGDYYKENNLRNTTCCSIRECKGFDFFKLTTKDLDEINADYSEEDGEEDTEENNLE